MYHRLHLVSLSPVQLHCIPQFEALKNEAFLNLNECCLHGVIVLYRDILLGVLDFE